MPIVTNRSLFSLDACQFSKPSGRYSVHKLLEDMSAVGWGSLSDQDVWHFLNVRKATKREDQNQNYTELEREFHHRLPSWSNQLRQIISGFITEKYLFRIPPRVVLAMPQSSFEAPLLQVTDTFSVPDMGPCTPAKSIVTLKKTNPSLEMSGLSAKSNPFGTFRPQALNADDFLIFIDDCLARGSTYLGMCEAVGRQPDGFFCYLSDQ